VRLILQYYDSNVTNPSARTYLRLSWVGRDVEMRPALSRKYAVFNWNEAIKPILRVGMIK